MDRDDIKVLHRVDAPREVGRNLCDYTVEIRPAGGVVGTLSWELGRDGVPRTQLPEASDPYRYNLSTYDEEDSRRWPTPDCWSLKSTNDLAIRKSD